MPKPTSSNVNAEKIKEFNMPVELIIISLDDLTLYLTDYTHDVEFFDLDGNPQTYYATGFRRSAVQTNLESRANEVTLEIDNVDQAYSSYALHYEFRGREVRVWKVFLDYLSYEDRIELFAGIMDSPAIDENQINVVAYSRLDLVDRQIPARTFSVQCQWEFGDDVCGVNIPEASGVVASTAENETRINFTSDLPHTSTDYWRCGYITIGNESRYVVGSGVDYVYIRVPFLSDPTGENYELQAGCDKSYIMPQEDLAGHFGCGRWQNQHRFGGFLNVPSGRGGD